MMRDILAAERYNNESHLKKNDMKTETDILKLLVPACALALLPACTAGEVPLSGYPASVEEERDVYYVSCAVAPRATDAPPGTGFITSLNRRGSILARNAFPGVRLDFPGGIEIEDGVLYVADGSRVVGISLRSGVLTHVFDLSTENTKALTGLAESDDFLYVTATDIRKIFRISLRDGSREEIPTSEPLDAPAGIDVDDGMIYVGEAATTPDGAPAGKIKAFPASGTGPRHVSVIHSVPGIYKGVLVKEHEDIFGRERDYLYFSDASAAGNSAPVRRIDLRTREAEDVVRTPMDGPADFIVEDGDVWVPATLDKKIVID